MNTTTLTVELMIIGGQVIAIALLWIHLMTRGVDATMAAWSRIWAAPDANAMHAALVIALAYPVGVLVDRLYDYLFEITLEPVVARRVTAESGGKKHIDFEKLRYEALATGGKTAELIEYLRSRLRITRSTAPNAVLFAVVFSVMAVGAASERKLLIYFAIAAAMCAAGALIAAYTILQRTYRRLLMLAELSRSTKAVGSAAGA